MAFKLNINSIDTNFPVPGVDNPSQGFRDNFSIIDNNFLEVDDVLGSLDEVAVRVNTANDFNGQGSIENVQLKKVFEPVNLSWDTSTEGEDSIDCNWSEARLYVIKVNDTTNPLQINLRNWPAAGYAKMSILLTKEGTNVRDVVWAAPDLVLNEAAVIKKLNFPVSLTAELSINDPVLVEAFTYNAGGTVFLQYVGKFV